MSETILRSMPRIAITMGDPCGIGPELLAMVLSDARITHLCSPLVVGSTDALRRALKLLNADLSTRVINDPDELNSSSLDNQVCILDPVNLTTEDLCYGNPTELTCKAVIEYINTAVRMAMDGKVEAICTCPIHKANLHRFGFPFPGHTEYLQMLTGSPEVVMMLAGPRLRVSLATIHHPLADVPRLLTRESLFRTIAVTVDALYCDFGLRDLRLAVAGLNPHAGEENRFGLEEENIIRPVVNEFRNHFASVTGPLSPDTVFFRAYNGEFDAVVAMYHDQGLIPIKLVHFYEAVNVTLGLPIIRTAVDHGTAYELAGSGKAHPGSLTAAVCLAVRLAANRKSHILNSGKAK